MDGRRLVLIRHAKAETLASSDSARTLAARGRRDAAAVGKWLAGYGVQPDLVVISPAQRTRQTWELAQHSLTGSPPVLIEPRIYENTIDDVLDVIREAAPEVSTLVIVGHNPSMEGTAALLDDGSGSAPRQELQNGFPTSGVAVFSVAGDWENVGPATATLESFAVPRG